MAEITKKEQIQALCQEPLPLTGLTACLSTPGWTASNSTIYEPKEVKNEAANYFGIERHAPPNRAPKRLTPKKGLK